MKIDIHCHEHADIHTTHLLETIMATQAELKASAG